MKALFKIISLINNILPKSKDRILLYSNLGFRDNVEVLYRYLIENEYHKNFKIICISNDFYSMGRTENVKYIGLYRGVFYFLFSKYFFFCAGKYPIKPSKKQMVVNLWHGIPLKKIGNLVGGFEHKDYNFFTKLVCFSKFFKPIMKSAFKANDEQLLIAGNVRNDDLFKPSAEYLSRKTILWMPTYRETNGEKNGANTLIFNMENRWKELNEILRSKNIELYLKLHPLEASLLKFDEKFSNIFLIDDKILSERKIPLYSFIGSMDALITDYSSVYFDYLLLNRPIGFVLDDYEEYSKNRGFVVDDIRSLMPGEKLYSYADLINFIENFDSEIDKYEASRREINDLVNEVKSDFCRDLLKKIDLK